ncbi:hypothetical protein HXX76_003412 [Chlamydomonas incerta]|uniref:Sulfotransferase n=1 Tax=Chlamydomonas incerta TaxID=51695 RepID=A0A835TMZ3_CHLIN|nr:hypothetical protein HXX76_003412 [Chlamydomonas incerta]|eukprot:KAG2441801.1 hypothetical protein HXX76_003412 [Chlamydomonas incerta]
MGAGGGRGRADSSDGADVEPAEEEDGAAGDAAAGAGHHAAGGGGGSSRCVVVLGTGRSGSSSLVDALNQLPHFFVRMEQEGAYWYLYLAWRLLEIAYSHSLDFIEAVRPVEARSGPAAAAHLSYRSAKAIYEQFAVTKKMPWFNDLHPVRMREAVRAFYTITYGYHGPGVVSGFKELRFVRGRAFSSEYSTYKDFADFMGFLQLLCADVKVLLNSRASSSLEDNYKLDSMLSRNGVFRAYSNETFARDLAATHEWFDTYAKEHPDHAFRVIMEDMYDAERNRTLMRDMLTFLGEQPDAHPHVVFNRMPSWPERKSAKPAKAKRPHPREPWQLRRTERRRSERRRRLMELSRWTEAMVDVEMGQAEEEEEDWALGEEAYQDGFGGFGEDGVGGL